MLDSGAMLGLHLELVCPPVPQLKPKKVSCVLIRRGSLQVLLFASLLVPAAAQQSNEAAIKQAVDAVVPPVMNKLNIPGFAVGISLKTNRHFFSYGTMGDNGQPFRPDTVVEIGSCTKVFTTTLAAEEALRGHLSLSASIQKYMPGGRQLKERARQVTPLELADFSSGMPELPPDAPRRLEARDIRNYTSDDFLRFVTRWEPPAVLPAPYLYSNASVGLLGYLIADAAGEDWADLLREKITGPLAMRDTSMRLTEDQRSRLAQGHRPNGSPAPRWPMFAWYAAGALRSTTFDMLSFGEANLGHSQVRERPTPSQLLAAMKMAQQPRYASDNGTQHAMSWAITNTDGEQMIFKNGGTTGFNSLILLEPSKDLAIFLVANQVNSDVIQIGHRIAQLIH